MHTWIFTLLGNAEYGPKRLAVSFKLLYEHGRLECQLKVVKKLDEKTLESTQVFKQKINKEQLEQQKRELEGRLEVVNKYLDTFKKWVI